MGDIKNAGLSRFAGGLFFTACVSRVYASVGLSERTALITRFRRACPGSERTSDGYIERPIIPPLAPFPRESPSAIPAEMGRVASGSLVAATCDSDRDKPSGNPLINIAGQGNMTL